MNSYNPDHIEDHAFFRAGIKVLVTDAGGRILLLRRSDKVSRSHGWDLPGGGLNAGEQPWHALEREMKEETGLTVKDIKLVTAVMVAANNGDPTLVMGYTASVAHGDMVLSWEHEAYEWIDPVEVGRYDLPRLHRYIVDLFAGTA